MGSIILELVETQIIHRYYFLCPKMTQTIRTKSTIISSTGIHIQPILPIVPMTPSSIITLLNASPSIAPPPNSKNSTTAIAITEPIAILVIFFIRLLCPGVN